MAAVLSNAGLLIASPSCLSGPRTRLLTATARGHLALSGRTHPALPRHASHAANLQSSFTGQVLVRRDKEASPIRRPGHLGAVSQLKPLEETAAQAVFGEDGSLQNFPASAGVYAVYAKDGALQYIGLSRRLAASIQTHAESLPDLCATVKVGLVDAPSREALTEAWKAWMQEHIGAAGTVPPGNAEGEKAWTSKPARRAKPEIRLTPGPHVQLTVPIEELLEKIVKDFKVVAFIKGTRTAPQCGFSHRVLSLLNELRADYETLNVLDEDHNPGLREGIKSYSQWPTIPQLYINGEFIGGADILDEMAASGELKKILGR